MCKIKLVIDPVFLRGLIYIIANCIIILIFELIFFVVLLAPKEYSAILSVLNSDIFPKGDKKLFYEIENNYGENEFKKYLEISVERENVINNLINNCYIAFISIFIFFLFIIMIFVYNSLKIRTNGNPNILSTIVSSIISVVIFIIPFQYIIYNYGVSFYYTTDEEIKALMFSKLKKEFD